MKKEMYIKFGELLGKSWKEYRANFTFILKVFLVLAAIPALILFFNPNVIYLNNSLKIGSVQQIRDLGAITISSILFLSLIANVFSVLMKATFISAFMSKKTPEKASAAIREGLNYLLRLIGLIVITVLALIPLYLLLIIPGIIFTVYWAFSAYVLIGEKRGIIESLRHSFYLVKGRWWRVFGYFLLIILTFICVALLITIPSFIITKLISLVSGKGIIYGLVSEIISLGVALITTPLLIIFMKNFYTDLRARDKTWKTKMSR